MNAAPARVAPDAEHDRPGQFEIVRADRIADPLDPAYRAALAAEGRQQARRRGDGANERVRGLVERVHRAGGLEPPPCPAFGDCED